MACEPWDVIIVGAGPAGAALATRLARRHRVLVLERCTPSGTERRRRAIGESLPGAAARLLQHFGVFERFLADDHHPRAANVSCWDQESPVWLDPFRDPCGPGWHLRRERYERCFREAALDAGARLLQPCGRLQLQRQDGVWQVLASQRPLGVQAPVLVDATGRAGSVARRLGLRRHAEPPLICLHLLLPAAEAAAVAPLDRCTRVGADRRGWWYSVTLPGGERLLALHLDPADPECRQLLNSDQLLARARRLPLLAEVLPAAIDPMPVQSCRADGSALQDHALSGFYAIGDASISFDPIASQGLFHALATAEAAAGAIETELAGAAGAQASYQAHLQAVRQRYRLHHRATYAGPAARFAEPFWLARAQGSMVRSLPKSRPGSIPFQTIGRWGEHGGAIVSPGYG